MKGLKGAATPVLTSLKKRKGPPAGATGKAARLRWQNDPDVCLMLRVREGDDAAFAELVGRYGSRVFGYCWRQMGDRLDAEDLTQEVFLRLYRYRGRYQPRAGFSTWVFHVTQNVLRNALRSRRRHPCVHLDTQPSDSERLMEQLLSADNDAPFLPVERAEMAGVVRAAVAELAERQRTAMEMHHFGDQTYAEVAAELDMTPKAAKSLLYRARNHLRVSLAPFVATT
jgi:RNA polymerase sigma-70 factor (ECF subfamily)